MKYNLKKMNIGEKQFFPSEETSLQTLERNLARHKLPIDNYNFRIIDLSLSERYYEIERNQNNETLQR